MASWEGGYLGSKIELMLEIPQIITEPMSFVYPFPNWAPLSGSKIWKKTYLCWMVQRKVNEAEKSVESKAGLTGQGILPKQ